MINTALRECSELTNQFISVNISARNLTEAEFPALLERALRIWGVTPNRLILEVTETMIMSNMDETKKTLQKLSDMGVMLAIDDFGSGYSSLRYIRDIPVSYLKIDGGFLENIETNKDDRSIVDAVTNLGHSFGLKVIAEGVMSEGSSKLAAELGCDLMQGNYMAEPMRIEDVRRLV